MASEAARQYFVIDGLAIFSLYGVNSIIATMAVFVAVDIAVRLERSRDCRCSACLSHRAAPMDCDRCQPFFVRVPQPDAGNLDKLGQDHLCLAGRLRLVDRRRCRDSLRGAGIGPYQSPVFRAFWLSVVGRDWRSLPCRHIRRSLAATFRLSSYNVWEWSRAKLFKPTDLDTSPVDTAAVELSQPHLLEAELNKLLPERKGTTDVYAICCVAGWSAQNVLLSRS